MPESISSQNDAVMGMAVVSDHSQFTERLDGITKLFMAIAAIFTGRSGWQPWDSGREIAQAGGNYCRGTGSSAAPLEELLCSNF